MNPESSATKPFLYPPGGILIWIIVMVEVLTFGMALLLFRMNFHQHYDSFLAAQNTLSKYIGLFNTIVLITSGYFMATALVNLKNGKQKNAGRWLLFTILMGIVFLLVKTWEYGIKIEEGHGFGFNQFFDFYWMLTVFHYIHVLVGIVILSVLWLKIRRAHYNSTNFMDVETGGVFWHMCDLIWILLFPVLYLLH